MDQNKALKSLSIIAEKPQWTDAFIHQLLAFEKTIDAPGIDVREEITGPLVDALYDDNRIIRKELADGTVFEFYYRSKIARDFVMAEPAKPDHAWEPQTTRLLLKLARGVRQVVIGGAYFGDQTILVARELAKSGGIAHAFEPNHEQRRMLVHNAEINGLKNIRPRAEGLWDNSSSHLALVGYDSFAYPEAVEHDNDESFKTVTIDDYLAAEGVDRLDLIMLDIEGAELRALKGAQRFLANPADSAPNIVFEVHRNFVDWTEGLKQTELIAYLEGFGYQVYAVRDFNSNVNMQGKPIELIPIDSIYLEGPPHGFNMVAVKDSTFFQSSDFLICRDVSPKLLRHKAPALHHPIGGL